MNERFNSQIVSSLVAQFDEDDNEEAAENTVEKTEEEPKEEQPNLPVSESMLQGYGQTSRFKGGDWFGEIQKTKASLIGVGGIGSWVAFNLARTGIGSLDIFDGDTIDDTNMAGQLYRLNDIGLRKADAIKKIIKEYVPTLAGSFLSENFEGQYSLHPITITALDSMDARKMVWRHYKETFKDVPEEEKSKCLFVDGRMNAELFQVFCFRLSQKDRVKEYEEKCLFDSSKAMTLPCSYKATTFIGCMIGGYITTIVKNHLSLKDDGVFANNVKFFNEFDTGVGIKITQTEQWQII